MIVCDMSFREGQARRKRDDGALAGDAVLPHRKRGYGADALAHLQAADVGSHGIYCLGSFVAKCRSRGFRFCPR